MMLEDSSAASSAPISTIPAAPQVALAGLPAFPEDADRPAIDWSALDWETEIVTPEAEQEFVEQYKRLLSEGKEAEAKELKKHRVPLYDSEALGFLRPPATVKDAAQEFGVQLKALEEELSQKKGMRYAGADLAQKKELKDALKLRLQHAPSAKSQTSTQAVGSVPEGDGIDLGVLKAVEPANAKNYRILQEDDFAESSPRIDSFQHELQQDLPINSIPTKGFEDLLLSPPGPKKTAQRGILSYLIPVALADEGSTLMNYYDGIENTPIDFLLLSLVGQQNEDGSIGRSNQYVHTFRIAETLSQMDKAYTDEYAAMIEYLKTTEPTNNRDKALKVILLQSLGQSTSSLMDDLAGQFTTVAVDGVPRIVGIGLLPGHEPDVETMIAFANASLVTGLHTDLLPYTVIWISNRIDPAGYLRYNASALPSLHLVNTVAQSLIRFRGLSYTFGTQTVVIDQKISLLLKYLRSSSPTDLVDNLMTLRTFEMFAEDAGAIRSLRDATIRSQSPDGNFGSSLYDSAIALSALRESDFEITDVTPFAAENHQPFNVMLNTRNTGQLPLWSLKFHIFAGKVFLGTHTVALATPLTQFEERSVMLSLSPQFTNTLLGSVPLTFYAEIPSETDENDNWATATVNFQPSSSQLNGALPPAYPLLTQAYLTYTQGQVRVDGRFQYRQDSRRSNLRIVLKHVETGHIYSASIPTSGFVNGSFYNFSATLPTGELDEYQVQLVAETSGGIQYGETAISAWVQTYDIVGYSTFTVRQHSDVLPSVDLRTIGADVTTDESGIAVQDFARTGRHYTHVTNAQFEPFIYRYDIKKDQQTAVGPVITRGLLDTIAPQIISVRIRNGSSGPTGTFHAPGTHTIEVSASDDTLLRSAAIEYWNPNENQWHLVAVVPFDTPTLARFEWSVSDSLVGNGFKIRAKVTDAGSNESGILESDPFNLIGSSVISIVGLTDGTWGLGETKTVNLDFSSIPSVNSVDGIYIHSDAYSYWFTGSFTGTQKILTMPLNATRLAAAAYLEARIYSENFSKLTTVFSPIFSVVDRTPPPSAPWHTPTTFADPSPGSLLSRTFEYIDERADGGVDVVYSEVDGSLVLGTQEWRRLIFRSLRNGAWQPPIVINEYQVFSESDRNIYDQVDVKRDMGDGLHVFYHTQKYLDIAKTKIFSALVRNQQLIRHEELTTGTPETWNPAFAVSPDGSVVIAAWQDRTGVPSSTLGNLIMRRRTVTGWGPAEILQAEGKYLALVTDGTTASIVFSDAIGLKYRYFDGIAWNQPQPLRNSSGQEFARTYHSQLFAKSDGTFDLFFRALLSDNLDHLYHLAFDPVGSGQPVLTVEDHDLVSSAVNEFDVLSPSSSEYHVLYTKNNGDGTGYINGYLSIISGQVQQGANVYPLIQSVRKPLLDQVKKDLVAFAEVQASGFDEYMIQRNYASILVPQVVNQPPTFLTPTTFTILENRPVGHVVGTLNTSDPEGQTVTYSIVGGDPNAQFAINATTGQITVAKANIDFESTSQFILQVKAQDNGTPSSFSTQGILITIGNINESPFMYPAGPFTISENRPIGHNVGTVTSSDPEGQTVMYSIVGGDPNAQFAINATSGQITVAKATINYESTTQFNLIIRGTDTAVPASSKDLTVTINIADLNEAPTFSAPTTFAISENRPIGHIVGSVSTFDPEGQTVTYSIVGGDPNAQFAINATSGQITVAKATIDYETTTQYLLQVKAQDNGNPANSRTQTITVNINNLNEAPSFLAPTSFTIAENRPVGFTVGDVNTYDPEGQTVTYSIVGGDPSAQFTINATTGVITVATATIDYETTTQHLLQVKAQDNGNPANSRTQTIAVNVTNLQE
jgi:hypothetical protein